MQVLNSYPFFNVKLVFLGTVKSFFCNTT